jgi:hypothetical protein
MYKVTNNSSGESFLADCIHVQFFYGETFPAHSTSIDDFEENYTVENTDSLYVYVCDLEPGNRFVFEGENFIKIEPVLDVETKFKGKAINLADGELASFDDEDIVELSNT